MKNIVPLITISLFLLSGCAGLTDKKTSKFRATADDKTGIIVVDVQGDFTTWKDGSLAVPQTSKRFVTKVEDATRLLKTSGYMIFGTQDWHPSNHISFYSNHSGKKAFEQIKILGRSQVLWPEHCIKGTENARILVDNNLFMAIVKKGQDPRYDSYSGFNDDGGQKTAMLEILKRNNIEKLIIYGIATDYCVKATAIDAVKEGFKVAVIKELCKGVAPDTTKKALNEMSNMYGITLFDKLDLQSIFEF